MRDLGQFLGTNHPNALSSYPEDARNLNYLAIILAVLVAFVFAFAADAGLSRADRAHEMENV